MPLARNDDRRAITWRSIDRIKGAQVHGLALQRARSAIAASSRHVVWMETTSEALACNELLSRNAIVCYCKCEICIEQFLHAIVLLTHVTQQAQYRVIEITAFQRGAFRVELVGQVSQKLSALATIDDLRPYLPVSKFFDRGTERAPGRLLIRELSCRLHYCFLDYWTTTEIRLLADFMMWSASWRDFAAATALGSALLMMDTDTPYLRPCAR